MRETALDRNGTGEDLDSAELEFAARELAEETATIVPGAARWPMERLLLPAPKGPTLVTANPAGQAKGTMAMFCHEPPESQVGRWVAHVAGTLGSRQTAVHLFSRQPFNLTQPGIHGHAVGVSEEGDLLAQVQDFTSRACNAFLGQFPNDADQIGLLGCEWSCVPVLSLVRGSGKNDVLLSLHSLERQRSDLSAELSREIEAIERAGLREAQTVFFHDESSAQAARALVPECAGNLQSGQPDFPLDAFDCAVDAGAVKARYQVGPIDPTILCIGDLDERHGPDVLLKSMPAVLKNHKQARLIVVGDGTLLWPLRVYARYLLLEHAVRLVGSVEGPALCELIQAADIVAATSREQTEWWPIQAAWAAQRPVVASQEMAAGLDLENEKDAVLVYPHESSCVWGIERLLFDAELCQAIGRRGREKLEQRFGWSSVAARIERALGVSR